MNNENNFNEELSEGQQEAAQEMNTAPEQPSADGRQENIYIPPVQNDYLNTPESGDSIVQQQYESSQEPVQQPMGETLQYQPPMQESSEQPQQNVYTAPEYPAQQDVPEQAQPHNAYNAYGESSPELMRNSNSYQSNGFNPYAPQQQENSQQYYSQPQQYNPQPGYSYTPTPEPGKNKNNGMKAAIAVIAACVVVAVLIIFVSFGSTDKGNKVTDAQNETTSAAVNSDSSQQEETTGNNVAIATTQAQSGAKDAVWIAEKVRPSIVGVMVYEGGQLAGEGSGVLMSENGGYTYVVTCAHVVEASDVTYGILLLDGRSFEAELVASDTRTDIAVLKVQQTGLPVAEFGDSSTLKVGETIYAIGNPGGSEYFGSMTDGIVSAIDRSITATYTMTCIQHNAAINPGNSGGALVNSQGQVIGINSSKIASTEYEGMGFAVPTAIAKPVVDALIQYGYVPNRPKLGIEYAPVSSYQLYSMVVSIKGLPKGSLVIAGISDDSSLANTSAQVGDLIIGVNGKDMDDSSVLLDLIDTGAVGDTLTLKLCRIESRTYKTSTFDVTITLVEDKGKTQEETTTRPTPDGGYNYGGAESFEDFFNDYFGEFGW